MKNISIKNWISAISTAAIIFAGCATSHAAGNPAAGAALNTLKDGNARFLEGKSTCPRDGESRIKETSENGQHPLVSILSCADSRVPLEVVFDQGIGDIFVVRVAGNVADTDEVGTIEYGVGHLGTPLVVVLGHTMCGAVTAVVKGDKVGGNIPQLVDNIVPAALKAKKLHADLDQPQQVAKAIEYNVFQSIEDLFNKSEEIREMTEAGKVEVVGAIYDIKTGAVTWLGPHPDQEEILHSAGGGEHEEEAEDAHEGSHGGHH